MFAFSNLIKVSGINKVDVRASCILCLFIPYVRNATESAWSTCVVYTCVCVHVYVVYVYVYAVCVYLCVVYVYVCEVYVCMVYVWVYVLVYVYIDRKCTLYLSSAYSPSAS